MQCNDRDLVKNGSQPSGLLKDPLQCVVADFEPRQGLANPQTIILIEQRRLLGECLGRCISAELGCRVKLFCDVDALENADEDLEAVLIILTFRRGGEATPDYDNVERLSAVAPGAPLIFLSDSAEVSDFCQSLSWGARGHLPTSVAFDVGIEALRLVLAGGVFVPADSFVNGQGATSSHPYAGGKDNPFTDRQSAVVDALRKGKPNKLIAHELNMSESTVKVHIHNIMKKLGAKNRTEVAIKVGELGYGYENCG
jgi:DNA-binding NarL/FixJ family response regulator